MKKGMSILLLLLLVALIVLGACGDECPGYCYSRCYSGTMSWIVETCSGSCPSCPGGTIFGGCTCR